MKKETKGGEEAEGADGLKGPPRKRGAENGSGNEEEAEAGGGEGSGKPGPQVMWVRPESWEKLVAAKNEMGVTWSEMAEIVVEQLIASGIIGEVGEKAIRKIEGEKGGSIPKELSWRGTFGIGSPWPNAGRLLEATEKGIAEMNLALEDLMDVIEDHAAAVLETEEPEEPAGEEE